MRQNIFNNNVSYLSMYYGTIMGVFWILKFMLIPQMFNHAFNALLFLLLTISVPFVGYYLGKQYRNKYCPQQQVSFFQAWIFCLLMYFFAALLVSVAHYIYFRYLDQGTLFDSYYQLLDTTVQISPEYETEFTSYKEALSKIQQLKPIELTIQLISNNLFYGMFFALPTAFILSLKKKKENLNSTASA